MEVLHPTTAEPVGITIQLGDGRRALLDWLIAERRRDDDQLAIDAASVTVGWSGVELDGCVLAFSPAAAVRVYSTLPWLAEAVLRADFDAGLADVATRLCEVVGLHVAGSTKPIRLGGAELIYWQWFVELCGTRQSSFNGSEPISYAEIAAWSALTGTELRPRDVKILRAIDSVMLQATREKARSGREIPASNPAAIRALISSLGKKPKDAAK